MSSNDSDSDEDLYDQWSRKAKNYEDNESATESDEDNVEQSTQTFPDVLKNLTQNHIKEIYKILELRQDASFKNALEINKEMQNKLYMLRTQIQTLRVKIVSRYALNQERLVENMNGKKNKKQKSVFGKFIKGRTFYVRGNTFFKNENDRNCPNNEDYERRCSNGEEFPMDFELVARHIWSITDKLAIVDGIKEQLKSENIQFAKKNVQLSTILEKVGNNFQIDWVEISSSKLSYRHSPTSCKAMWEVYLHPTLKHDSFSTDENERLVKAAQKYNYQNWAAIAKEVGKRSDYQCFLHYHTSLVNRQGWSRWNKSDDSRLLEAIDAAKFNGVINWSQVAFKFPQKSKAALQQRYQYAIKPTISHEPFSAEEDMLILAAVQEYGSNFAKMPRHLFPNRSHIQLKQRYNNTIRNRDKIAPWTLADDKILMEFVRVHGASSWKKCAEEAFENRHTRISCRQRYMVIQKHMKKDVNFSLEQIQRKPVNLRRSDVTPTNWQQKVEDLKHNGKDNHNLKREKRKREDDDDDDDDEVPLEFEESQQNLSTKEIAVLCENTAVVKKSIQGKKKKARRIKNRDYTERLRANGLKFHNFFKFSYNFRFGRESFVNNTNYLNEIALARECLGFDMTKNAYKKLQSSTDFDEDRPTNINGLCRPVERIQGLRTFLTQEIPKDTTLEPSPEKKLPPNFSTLAALRALFTLPLNLEKLNKSSETDVVTQKKIQVPNTMAVDRFRKRFHNLFYQSVVLSRLPPSSLENQNLVNHSCKESRYHRTYDMADYAVASHTIKKERHDEDGSFSPSSNIKTEIVLESYKETNPSNEWM